MRTQETYSLIKAARDIGVAIDADGDRIGGKLNEQNPLPAGEGESAFDYRQHMRSLRLQLDASVEHVAEAEDGHAARLIRLSREQSERESVTDDAYGKMVTERQGLEAFYPRGGFELAFLKGKTPRVPERLLEQLVQTVKLLKQPAVEPREPKSDSFNLDLEKVAKNLEPCIPDLRGAIDRYRRASKEVEGSLVAKQKAVKQLRRTVVWVGRTTEGLFFLAEEDELARRIRKSTRRQLRPSEQAAAEESKGEAPPSEASASDAPEATPEAQAEA